ncbi:hypothetical protein MesoLjLa_69050 (plasmid) [Mesorhizobium sp. L-2-11]|nr:hypothetical protein MesoLjLa_69050 [Mesorhizobium sp. L-2-11]
MAADLLARRGLARTQDHGDRTSGRGVIDVDRQEAALVVMGVEERELLMAVNDIHRHRQLNEAWIPMCDDGL